MLKEKVIDEIKEHWWITYIANIRNTKKYKKKISKLLSSLIENMRHFSLEKLDAKL